MVTQLVIFIGALTLLLLAARVFTKSAESIGAYLNMPTFVVGVFIVGVGTSLPELISSIMAVRQGVSEIVPGNVMGANISNLLFITGVVAFLHRRDIVLSKPYIFIDLHYLIGAMIILATIAYDGIIKWPEATIGILAFLAYSFYLIQDTDATDGPEISNKSHTFPIRALILLLGACIGIYFGADYTVSSVSNIAAAFGIPPAIIALTVLSIGTTLPELAVNIAAIREGKAELAIGNVLGSCIFNAMVVPGGAAFFGDIQVSGVLLDFSLPFMLGCGLFFYLLTQDKKLSFWEGILFILIYALFIMKVAGL
jgi:cation:H+ antiporter